MIIYEFCDERKCEELRLLLEMYMRSHSYLCKCDKIGQVSCFSVIVELNFSQITIHFDTIIMGKQNKWMGFVNEKSKSLWNNTKWHIFCYSIDLKCRRHFEFGIITENISHGKQKLLKHYKDWMVLVWFVSLVPYQIVGRMKFLPFAVHASHTYHHHNVHELEITSTSSALVDWLKKCDCLSSSA